MKNKKTPYLDLYLEWHHRGKVANFLCTYFGKNNELFSLLKPTSEEKWNHYEEGWCMYAWGERNDDSDTLMFTDLRQNIILLMAAMNDEL